MEDSAPTIAVQLFNRKQENNGYFSMKKPAFLTMN
jgi:hypothetical protein